MAKRGEIVGLQYLRGIAAIAVVVYHVGATMVQPNYFGPHPELAPLELGRLGVDLFFLISGFIISVVSLEPVTLAPATSRAGFFLRRFARIVPLMWIAVFGFAALQVAKMHSLDMAAFLRGLTLFPGETMPDVLWTLRNEFIFYAVFALAFLNGGRRPIWLMAAWLALPFAYALAGMPSDPKSLGMLALRTTTHPINLEFGFGLAVGLAWSRARSHAIVDFGINPLLPMIALFVLLILGARFAGFAHRDVPNVLLLAILLTPLLVLGVHVRCQAGPLDRLGRLCGDASFAIYLFHRLVLSPLFAVWAHVARGTPIALVVLGGTLVAIAVGIALHLYLEKPLVRFVQRSLIHPPRRTAGV